MTTPDFGCYSGEFWAVSQAAPMRRVHVNGQTTLMDYCTGPSFASGGFIADSLFENGADHQRFAAAVAHPQQRARPSWTNGVWNQVFSGTVGAPAQCFPAAAACGGPYTTLTASPVTPGDAVPLRRRPRPLPGLRPGGTSRLGRHLVGGRSGTRPVDLPRGVLRRQARSTASDDQRQAGPTARTCCYPGRVPPRPHPQGQASRHRRPRSGHATLVPQQGQVAMTVADVPGVDIAGARSSTPDR